jgi:UDP-N-acetylglucosamine 4,6-dehydratase
VPTRSILVTGATGSFGQAFVRRLLEGDDFQRIIVYSRDELKQWQMHVNIPDPDNRLRFFLGDVRDVGRVTTAMRGVDTVIHAAALKQVPALEFNPSEAVKTNVLGAMNVIEAAMANGVGKVLALSTDKSCAPVNLYGATKLCAEKLFQAANAMVGDRPTRFSCVRYGNVSGSRGSVIPLWREALIAGEPLKITHPDMTRFWLTLDGAVDLVLRCLEVMKGAEVFVPKLRSYSLKNLAEAVLKEAGAKAVPEVVGIRPGEKMHESMISEHEGFLAWTWTGGFALIPEPTIDMHTEPPAGAERTKLGGVGFRSQTSQMGVGELVELLRGIE